MAEKGKDNSSGYDVIIIGGGPGGYVAAIRASQLGLRTALIEREHLGGICLNWGCIPTKALLRSSELYHLLKGGEAFGLVASDIGFDLEKIVARSRKVASQLSGGVKFLMKKNRIDVHDGEARLLPEGGVEVRPKDGAPYSLEAPHIVLATGARARTLDGAGLGPDDARIWTYREAMLPSALPGSLLIIGSGAIGIEFASFYNALGSDVTVVEIMERILPAEDAEISELAQKAFQRRGMTFMTSTEVKKLAPSGDGVRATLKDANGKGNEQTLEVERVILAIGITGNVEDLGLEARGVRVERGHIVTDAWCRTTAQGVYAIGDVAGPPWLAHKASHEGILCVERIAGLDETEPLKVERVPGCTYSSPQIASIGLTEEKARAAGHSLRVGRFPLRANGKAIALGETEGLVKTIFDAETGELLGAHMIGPEVTELIQGYAVAMGLESTEAELAHTIFPHPTLSEAMHEAVLDAYGRVLHT